jgi:hypothetical protein
MLGVFVFLVGFVVGVVIDSDEVPKARWDCEGASMSERIRHIPQRVYYDKSRHHC